MHTDQNKISSLLFVGSVSESVWDDEFVRGRVDPVRWTGCRVLPISLRSAAARNCILLLPTLRYQLLIPALDCPQLWRDKIYGKKSSQYSRLALKADPSEKYLDVVASGQMSILDLRIYMFSKQANLLRRLNRLDEAIKRASIFISSFAAFLRSHEVSGYSALSLSILI